ncbi:MAG TPA: helix-hairpin-helix domain-containing protein, partial [Firmicutes bacterium]|nr:helix-hairpin-helix domain-containing protein [Bacillota bacterium]
SRLRNGPWASRYSAIRPASTGPIPGAAAEHRPAVREPLDINAASAEELEQLPGIGPVLAGRIAEYREAHGPFRSLDELRKVSGIGEKKLAALEGLAVCSGSVADARSRE